MINQPCNEIPRIDHDLKTQPMDRPLKQNCCPRTEEWNTFLDIPLREQSRFNSQIAIVNLHFQWSNTAHELICISEEIFSIVTHGKNTRDIHTDY